MSAQRRLLPRARERIQPDVSLAIVNIVLLLILFFLATGALINASATEGVDVAETTDLPIEQLPRPILVVTSGGGLVLDGEPVLAEALETALSGASLLHVLIDRTAPAMDLLELLEQPGLAQLDIRLVTIHRRGGT